MFQVILRFALRQSDCRFFHFSAENLPIPLRVNDLRNLSVSGTIFGITTIKRTHNSLRIRTYRSVDSRELKTVWNQHLQKNRGEGGLIVNQIPDERESVLRSIATKDLSSHPMRMRILSESAAADESKDLSSHPTRESVLRSIASERSELVTSLCQSVK